VSRESPADLHPETVTQEIKANKLRPAEIDHALPKKMPASLHPEPRRASAQACTTLEATFGQIDGFLSQLPYKCHQNRVASEGD
jgi:hypothetical protein